MIWEFAARDNVVLVGRGSTFVLQRLRHAFRVRVTAPLHVRARRLEAERGLVPDAEEVVAKSDRDWAARIRHLYDAGLDDPLQYDLVLNTARLDLPTAVASIRAALTAERFHATATTLAEARDRCLTARVHAALLCHPRTRELGLFFSCRDGQVSLSGRVARDDQRRVAEEVRAGPPGCRPRSQRGRRHPAPLGPAGPLTPPAGGGPARRLAAGRSLRSAAVRRTVDREDPPMPRWAYSASNPSRDGALACQATAGSPAVSQMSTSAP